jgi:hypothetical protein
LFSLRYEFGTEWYKFLNPEGGNDQEFVVSLKPEHFPFFIRGKLGILKIKRMEMFVETFDEDIDGFTANSKITSGAVQPDFPVDSDAGLNNIFHSTREFTPGSFPNALGEVKIKMKVNTTADFKSLTQDQVNNIFILFQLST